MTISAVLGSGLQDDTTIPKIEIMQKKICLVLRGFTNTEFIIDMLIISEVLLDRPVAKALDTAVHKLMAGNVPGHDHGAEGHEHGAGGAAPRLQGQPGEGGGGLRENEIENYIDNSTENQTNFRIIMMKTKLRSRIVEKSCSVLGYFLLSRKSRNFRVFSESSFKFHYNQ